MWIFIKLECTHVPTCDFFFLFFLFFYYFAGSLELILYDRYDLLIYRVVKEIAGSLFKEIRSGEKKKKVDTRLVVLSTFSEVGNAIVGCRSCKNDRRNPMLAPRDIQTAAILVPVESCFLVLFHRYLSSLIPRTVSSPSVSSLFLVPSSIGAESY